MATTTFDTSAAAIAVASTTAPSLTNSASTTAAATTTTTSTVAPTAPGLSLDGIVLTAVFGGAFLVLIFLMAIFLWTRRRRPTHHVELGRTVTVAPSAHSARNSNSLNTPSSLTLGPAHDDGQIWTDVELSELPYLRPDNERANDAAARPATPAPTATTPDNAEAKSLTATQRLLARSPTPYPHFGRRSPDLNPVPAPTHLYYAPAVLPPVPSAVRVSMPIMPGTAVALARAPSRARSASTAATPTYPWGAQRDARA